MHEFNTFSHVMRFLFCSSSCIEFGATFFLLQMNVWWVPVVKNFNIYSCTKDFPNDTWITWVDWTSIFLWVIMKSQLQECIGRAHHKTRICKNASQISNFTRIEIYDALLQNESLRNHDYSEWKSLKHLSSLCRYSMYLCNKSEKICLI